MSISNILEKNNLSIHGSTVSVGSYGEVLIKSTTAPEDSYEIILPDLPPIHNDTTLVITDYTTGQTEWKPITQELTHHLIGSMNQSYTGVDKDVIFSYLTSNVTPIPLLTMEPGRYKLEILHHCTKGSAGSNIGNFKYRISGSDIFVTSFPFPYKSSLFSTNNGATVSEVVIIYFEVASTTIDTDISWEMTTEDGSVFDNWDILNFTITISKVGELLIP